MKTDVAHAAKYDQIIICIISISAYLAFSILVLTIFIFLLEINVTFC